ncbi:MAG: DUF2202 domain-containing protein [Ardenticatenaceae bacterium]|nr:DUF2202 domain-containing protein [Anaerolineales bacterium]MCB8980412.1 DUF2202 domain-containing protein [Ardenticatenaceae bacterium]
MLENTNSKTTGKRLMSWKSFLGLGIALFIIGGLVMLVKPAAAQTTATGLTTADIESLLYMREEEKLAHDVYVTLYDMWEAPIFNNIASSEQNHTDMVLSLLNQYGLEDPAVGNAVGVFTNPDLQALYDDLVSQGSQSYEAALLVGGLIEEVDIADLRDELESTNVAAIQQVYQSLLSASGNHLNGFANAYESATGNAYTAQLLSDADVTAILSGGNSSGHGNSQGSHGSSGQGSNGQSQGNGGSQGNNGQGNSGSGRGSQGNGGGNGGRR